MASDRDRRPGDGGAARPASGRSGDSRSSAGGRKPPARGAAAHAGGRTVAGDGTPGSAAAARRRASGTAARTARAAPPGTGAATSCPRRERTAVQAEYDGPPMPDDITGQELDRAGLATSSKSLPEKLAARVARHLVAAGPADGHRSRDGLSSTPSRRGPARPGCRSCARPSARPPTLPGTSRRR